MAALQAYTQASNTPSQLRWPCISFRALWHERRQARDGFKRAEARQALSRLALLSPGGRFGAHFAAAARSRCQLVGR